MTQLVICPSCRKTVYYDGSNPVCTECGQTLDFNKIRKNNLLIDSVAEAREFAAGKDYFVNTEFLGASEHFKKALAANGNSYLSLYFVMLCDIYLNEAANGYDIMAHAINAVYEPLELMSRSNVSVNDKHNFIVAMLNEIKIIIINRLKSHDEIYELDSVSYRKKELDELQTLLKLFKIDDEKLMTYSPTVKSVLVEIADSAIAVCHKAVQTVAVGEELFMPTDYEYNRLMSLNNDYCFFAQSYAPDYDVKRYEPDFTQNDLLNDKVESRFEKFDAQNRQNAKKFIIGDVKEYDDILAECEKAVTFTDRSCYRSLCDPNNPKRKHLLCDGIKFLYRLLTPRIVVADKKRTEIVVGKFYDISDKCALLSKFLTDASVFGEYPSVSLHTFYDRLCDIVSMYVIPEYERCSKNVNKIKDVHGSEFRYYEKFLFDVACITASSLRAYIAFGDYKDKPRIKLVKCCKKASEEFLMLRDYHIDEIDQSNIYRPILDIYNAVMNETDM